tara:strand:- start:213 stop:464 length:252 start_codon:yes stop_codon:yes gene_type:complete
MSKNTTVIYNGREIPLTNLIDKERLASDLIDIMELIANSDDPSREAEYAIRQLVLIKSDDFGVNLHDNYLNLAANFLKLKGVS